MASGDDRVRRRQAIYYGAVAASGVVILAAAGILSNVVTDGWQLWPAVALIGLISAASLLAYFAESRSHLASITNQPEPNLPPIGLRVSTLPRNISDFTGREQEIAEIVHAIRDGTGSEVKIYVLEGMGGIGKSTLAVHVAHRLTDQYPDAQLFLDLRAHAAQEAPLDPKVALELLLSSLGVPAAQIPDAIDARAARWRALAARRKTLLVLDDATGTDQVRPLLPGTGDALVIITSRTRMTDLGDTPTFSIDAMDTRDSKAFLMRTINDPMAEEQDVAELAGLLGGIPLALRLAAGRLRAHRSWRVIDLVGELKQTEQSVTTRVHQSFGLSCRHLDQFELNLFCYLGLSPVPHLTAEVARVTLQNSLDESARGLDTLHGRYLLEEVAPGRFRFHDVIREYSADLAGKRLAPLEQRLARQRLIHYYTYAAEHADYALRPLRRKPMESNPVSEPPTTFDQALKWFDEELPNLTACAQTALSEGLNPHAWRLVISLSYMLRIRNAYTVGLDLLRSASDLADRHGSLQGVADSQREIGVLEARLARYPQARSHAGRALEIYSQLGEVLGQANAHRDLGLLDGEAGHLVEARRNTRTALAIYKDLNIPSGQSHAHLELGMFDILDGRPERALPHFDKAVRLAVQQDDDYGQFRAHLGLAEGWLHQQDTIEALHHATRAGEIATRLRDQLAQASAYTRIGLAHAIAGNFPEAEGAWDMALTFYREIEHPAAVAVQRLATRLNTEPRQPFTSESLYSIDGGIW